MLMDGSGVKLTDFSHQLPNMPTLTITEIQRHRKGYENVIVILNAVSHDGCIERYVCAQWLPLLHYLSQTIHSTVPDIQLLSDTVPYQFSLYA